MTELTQELASSLFPELIGKVQLSIGDLGDQLKGRGWPRWVLTKGVYDLPHVGHLYSLIEARRLGEILVVAIADDASVRRRKGANHPRYNPGGTRITRCEYWRGGLCHSL